MWGYCYLLCGMWLACGMWLMYSLSIFMGRCERFYEAYVGGACLPVLLLSDVARDFSTERVLSRTPLIIRTADQ